MESPALVRCWILAVVAPEGDEAAPRMRRVKRTADPYISQLITRLQNEVRDERRARPSGRFKMVHRVSGFDVPRLAGPAQLPRAEAEITWRESPLYFSEPDFDSWERTSVPPDKRCNLPR